MAATEGRWCDTCRFWKYDFHSGDTCTDCRPVRVKVSLEGLSKACSICHRELSSRCFIYDQFSEDRLRSECRSCYAYLDGTPTLAQVQAYEASMSAIISDAVRAVGNEPVKYRTELEISIYNKMHQVGLLKSWKPPVWIHKSSMRIEDDYQVQKRERFMGLDGRD
jgi:hypothetical protein